jgi:hypothetical protein
MLTIDGVQYQNADGLIALCWVVAIVAIIATVAFLVYIAGAMSDAKRVSEATAELEVGMTRGKVIELMSPNIPFAPKNYTVDSDGSMTFIVERGGFNVVTKRVRAYFGEDDRLVKWETLPY